jgi:glucuronate isomerase
MEAQISSLANLSILGNFVGMLTDSRSFLSYTRHEYFRRILCNYLGTLIFKGEYPADYDAVTKIAQDISYYNANKYFGLENN